MTEIARYRCRVGHAYSASSLLAGQDEKLEASIWVAIRLLEQRANVLTTMTHNDRKSRRTRMLEYHERLAREAREHANILRTLLVTAMNPAAHSRL
jgi:two-component system chemotaxis response regulator CheB